MNIWLIPMGMRQSQWVLSHFSHYNLRIFHWDIHVIPLVWSNHQWNGSSSHCYWLFPLISTKKSFPTVIACPSEIDIPQWDWHFPTGIDTFPLGLTTSHWDWPLPTGKVSFERSSFERFSPLLIIKQNSWLKNPYQFLFNLSRLLSILMRPLLIKTI